MGKKEYEKRGRDKKKKRKTIAQRQAIYYLEPLEKGKERGKREGERKKGMELSDQVNK